MKSVADYVRSIPDFPKEGVIFRDITTILQDPDGLQLAIDGLVKMTKADPQAKAQGAGREVPERKLAMAVPAETELRAVQAKVPQYRTVREKLRREVPLRRARRLPAAEHPATDLREVRGQKIAERTFRSPFPSLTNIHR